MNAGKLRLLSGVLFAGGFLLLLLSFLPRPAGQSETTTPENDRPAETATRELSSEQLANVGLALFQAKGCPTCHLHEAIDETEFTTEVGPNLTNYQPDPEFVRAWLRDPAAIRPNTQMPNLELSEEEIEALLAFLAE